MEALLVEKEAALEGQQAQLAAWAAELQRREAALAMQQASAQQTPAAGGGKGGAARPCVTWAALPPASPAVSTPGPEPIPSESPIIGRPGAAGVAANVAAGPASPLLLPSVPEAAEGADLTPPASGGAPALQQRVAAAPFAAPQPAAQAVGAGAAAAGAGESPAPPAAADEWTEEFEEVRLAVWVVWLLSCVFWARLAFVAVLVGCLLRGLGVDRESAPRAG
jgi:type II secretory pathway pseudopilin PulG